MQYINIPLKAIRSLETDMTATETENSKVTRAAENGLMTTGLQITISFH